MSHRMSSAKLQEGLPLWTVHAKSRKPQHLPACSCLPLVKFHPMGHPLPHFWVPDIWMLRKFCGILRFSINWKPWQGREEMAGVGVRRVLSGVVHGWYEGRGAAHRRTCLWFALAAVTGSRIKAPSQILVRDSVARTQTKCMYSERNINESVTFLLWRFFISYYYYQVTE